MSDSENIVQLIRNTNKGKKGEFVPDPDGSLVANRLAVPVGVKVVKAEVSDGEELQGESSESFDRQEAVEVEPEKVNKRKRR